MAETADIELENPLPFLETDPRKVARGFQIRQDTIDRSPVALHQHYQAMLDEANARQIQRVEELCAARLRQAEAEARALHAESKAKADSMAVAQAQIAEANERTLAMQQRLITAMSVVEDQQIKSTFVTMGDRSEIYSRLRQPNEREPSGGELVAQSYQKTVDGLVELLKSPSAQKTLGGLLGSIVSKFTAVDPQDGGSEAKETTESPQASPDAASADPRNLASLSIGELADLVDKIPAEKLVDKEGKQIDPKKLSLEELLGLVAVHYATS